MQDTLDWSTLSRSESERVRRAMAQGEDFYGHIPTKGFRFILENYQQLAQMKLLETNWMYAYLHASHFASVPLKLLQDVFDACDKDVLQRRYPIYVGDHFSRGERFSLFRGCAGTEHRRGMAWNVVLGQSNLVRRTPRSYYGLSNLSVYAAVVNRSEIYCCGDHYDFDYIVHPTTWWKIDVPDAEFRLDRPR